MDSDEWWTPAGVVQIAHDVMGGIDLDPMSCAEANNIVRAARWVGVEEDGYTVPWTGRVWLNPPYSRGNMDRVMAKLLRGFPEETMLLANIDTSTRWAQTALAVFDLVLFFDTRIAFVPGAHQATSTAKRPQALFYRGPNRVAFAFAGAAHGIVLQLGV